MLLDRIHHRNPLANGSAHGLLAPHILAMLCRLDGLQGVPVGRRTDVHHINIIAGTKLTEVVIPLRIMSPLLGVVGSIREVILVHVTER